MAKDIWRTYVKLHLRIFNLFARLFGLLAVAGGAGSIAWGLYYLLHSDLPSPGATVTGSFAVDHLVIGAFCLIMGAAFLAVRPWRPDLTGRTGARWSWWTGEPK
jgi:hypothetical protein